MITTDTTYIKVDNPCGCTKSSILDADQEPDDVVPGKAAMLMAGKVFP